MSRQRFCTGGVFCATDTGRIKRADSDRGYMAMGETGRKLCVCGILRRHGLAFAAGLAFAIFLFITVNAASKPLSHPEAADGTG